MSDVMRRGPDLPVQETSLLRKVAVGLEARVRQQEATGRIGLAALVGTKLGDLLDQAAEEVVGILGVDYCEVLELVPGGERLLLRAGRGWEEGHVGGTTVGTGLESQAGYTLISRGPVVVEDLKTERRFEGPPLLVEHGVTSGVTAKIQGAGRVFGVLGAHTKKRRAFLEEEVLFLQEVADVLGAAVVRSREESEARSLIGERTRWAAEAERRFAFLTEANARLSASTDVRTVLAMTARLAVPDLADLCFVDVVDEASATVSRVAVVRRDLPGPTGSLRESSSRGPYAPDAPRGTSLVMRTGRSELWVEATEETLREVLAGEPGNALPAGPGSCLCVPLRVGGRTLGALGLVSFGQDRRYGKGDLRLAEGLAHTAALALDNARHRRGEAELARELVELARGARTTPKASSGSADAPDLTARQMEVLRLLAEGKGVEEIRRDLFLSQATVRNHIRALLQALGAHSQLEAVARARKAGLLSG